MNIRSLSLQNGNNTFTNEGADEELEREAETMRQQMEALFVAREDQFREVGEDEKS